MDGVQYRVTWSASSPPGVNAMIRRMKAVPTVLALLLLCTAAAGAESGRILAIGDVHGAYDPLAEILRSAGVIDAQARWVGGDATLVQVGDFLDRGEGVLEVMDLLMRLQREAPRQGGQLIVLLGNHEVMNLIGVLRDVSPKVYEKLAGPEAIERQEKLWQAAAEIYRERHGEEPLPGFEEAWKARHPPGALEYAEAVGPSGKYGRWLRGLPSAVRLGDTFFLHAGLGPDMKTVDAEALTAQIHAEIELYDGYREMLAHHGLVLPVTSYRELIETAERLSAGGVALASLNGSKAEVRRASKELLRRSDNWALTDVHGPLWFRGFAKWNQGEGRRNVRSLARTLGVEHFVVGHSPVRDRLIHHRFDGAVFLTDTGMLSDHYEGGRPAVLERVGERWTAIYLESREVLLGPGPRQALLARDWRGPDEKPLPFRSDDEALAFLATAGIVSHEEIIGGTSRTLKVLLEKDGVRAHAAFRTVNFKKNRVTLNNEIFLDFHDSYRYELAAYELSRLLGLDQVPPVVERTIDGKKGSLQLWVEGAMTESERVKADARPPDWTAWYRQLQIMRIFDRLIYNYDRNRGNILIDEDWKLWMIDHTRSFRISANVPAVRTVTHCEKDLWRRLQEIEESDITDRLGSYLSGKQVKALMKRRDKVLARINEVVATYGEEHVIFDLDEAPQEKEVEFLADHEIEGFLDGLPDESEIPAELRAVATTSE